MTTRPHIPATERLAGLDQLNKRLDRINERLERLARDLGLEAPRRPKLEVVQNEED